MNALVPVPQQGNWVFDPSTGNWVCAPCDGTVPPFPNCPPPGFPPHGCPPWFSGMNSPPWYPGANAGVSFGNTAPMNAVRGHFWWNGMVLAIFDGAAWVNTTTGQIVPPNGGGGTPTPPSPPPGSVVISATAPGNPFAGMQWWDGSQLRVWDGVQWNVVGPGSAVGPVPTTTLSFAVTQPGYTTIGAAWAIFPITSTPQVDISSGWDPTTKRFTPKKAGVYMFESTVWEGSGGGIAIVKNDSGAFTNGQNENTVAVTTTSATGGYMQAIGTTIMNGATDFVRLWGFSGGTQLWGNTQPPLFSALLMP